jgi:integrase
MRFVILRVSQSAGDPMTASAFGEESRRGSLLKHFSWTTHSWKEAVVRYVKEVLPGSVKPSTANRYLVSLRQVSPYLKDLKVADIGTKVLSDLIGKRKCKDGATNATLNRDLTAVSRVQSSCVAWGWIETNSARLYDRTLAREKRDPIRRPTKDEIAAVLKKAPGNFARCIQFMLDTGVREAEAVGLEWSQVDLQAGTVTLTKTKTNRPRVIRLTSPGGDGVGTVSGTGRHPAGGRVFWHGDGEMYRNFSSRFAQVRSRAGAGFRAHDLLH